MTLYFNVAVSSDFTYIYCHSHVNVVFMTSLPLSLYNTVPTFITVYPPLL